MRVTTVDDRCRLFFSTFFRRFRIFRFFRKRLLGQMLRKTFWVVRGVREGFLGHPGGVQEASWGVLGLSGGVLGASWEGLGLPFPPPAASEQTGRNSLHFFFSPLKLPKALLTSLHFSSLFLSRLGSLLGSILAPSWAPFWPNFGPSRLLKPYLVQNR